MAILSTIEYLGLLRTTSQHKNSGVRINTDAPLDNRGEGLFFSPTDMAANSLGTCAITLMGICANDNNIKLGKLHADITKVMGANPRRIVRIVVALRIENLNFSKKEIELLENAALTCPVAKSLHPDIDQDFSFEYYEAD